MNKMEVFHQEYISRHSRFNTGTTPLPRRGPIRIAILDTGISWGDRLISGAKNQICGFWTPIKLGQAAQEDCEDRYGHGTQVARLLLEVAPSAHIFIAKISEGKHLEESKVDHIVKV